MGNLATLGDTTEQILNQLYRSNARNEEISDIKRRCLPINRMNNRYSTAFVVEFSFRRQKETRSTSLRLELIV